jgi:twinkle protein
MSEFFASMIEPITLELIQAMERRGFESEAFVKLDTGVGHSVQHPGALAVPYREAGRIVGLTEHQADTFAVVNRYLDGVAIYNADALTNAELQEQPLIVTDSPDGAWAAMIAGYPRAIAVPSIGVSAGTIAAKYAKFLEGVWEIALCLYADEHGGNLREDLAAVLGRKRCRVARYPKGCFNLAQALKQYGAKGVQETIKRAQWYPAPGIYALSDLPEPLPNPGFDCGMVGLREHYKLRRGDFCVVSGVPHSGKTSFVNEIVGRMAEKHGWRTVFASFEQNTKPDHRRMLRTFRAQKLEIDMTADEKTAADAWIGDHFRFLVPDEDIEANLDWLMETMAAAINRLGAQICVIDPWNELEHARSREMTQTEYTGFAIRALKRFAKKHRVHLIVIAHPAKLTRMKDGKYPQPSLYDIADSAHWANKPDVGVLIWRDGPQPGLPTSIVVAKSRYHDEIGRPGVIKGIWNLNSGRYTITNDGATA